MTYELDHDCSAATYPFATIYTDLLIGALFKVPNTEDMLCVGPFAKPNTDDNFHNFDD